MSLLHTMHWPEKITGSPAQEGAPDKGGQCHVLQPTVQMGKRGVKKSAVSSRFLGFKEAEQGLK